MRTKYNICPKGMKIDWDSLSRKTDELLKKVCEACSKFEQEHWGYVKIDIIQEVYPPSIILTSTFWGAAYHSIESLQVKYSEMLGKLCEGTRNYTVHLSGNSLKTTIKYPAKDFLVKKEST